MTVEFICEQLAEMFDAPCNFSPIDEIIWVTEHCQNNCGNGETGKCWEVYFNLIAEVRGEE